jgi:hypothetical protein
MDKMQETKDLRSRKQVHYGKSKTAFSFPPKIRLDSNEIKQIKDGWLFIHVICVVFGAKCEVR